MNAPVSKAGFGLTVRQRELLAYISEREHCPSYEEMAQALGLAAKSAIHRLVTGLEERGHIRRLPNRARAIEVVRDNPQPPPRASSLATKPGWRP